MDEATREQVEKTTEASVKAAREKLVVDPRIFEQDDVEHSKKVEAEVDAGDRNKEVKASEGSYFLPVNESETKRLNMQHHIFALSFSNRLSLAPITPSTLNGNNILDIGTGTGIWAIDFANQHSTSHVLGFDLALPSPKDVPSNCTFTTHDAETTPWPFPQKFTYIHARAMMSCFNDAGKVIKEAWEKLEDGGWLEMQDVIAPWDDVDGSMSGTTLREFHTLTIEAAKSIGRDVMQVIRYPSLFKSAGFSNITELHYQWPFGGWPQDPTLKKIGEMFGEDLITTLEPVAERLFIGVRKMERGEVGALKKGAAEDIRDIKRVRGYMPGLVVYGQKPFSA